MPRSPVIAQRAAAANIRRFYAFRFLNYFMFYVPVWILYLQDERGLTLTQIMVLEAAFETMSLLAEVPTGAVADRWGRRQSMLLGQIGLTGAIALFAWAPNFSGVLICYAVWAVASALRSGSDTALVHDSLHAAGRDGEFRSVIAKGQAAQLAGIAASSVIGGPLADVTSLQMTVILSIGVAVVTLPVVWTFRDLGEQSPSSEVRYFRLLGTAARYVAHQPRLRTLILMQGLFAGIAYAALVLAQSLFDYEGLPLTWIGVVLAGLQVLAFAGALSAPRVSGAIGSQPLIFFAPLITAGGLLAIGLVPLAGGILMFAVVRVALNMLLPVLMDHVNQESLDEVRATIASMGTMGISVVGVAAKPFFGWIADASSPKAPYIVAGIAMFVAAAFVLTAWTRISRRAEPVPVPARTEAPEVTPP